MSIEVVRFGGGKVWLFQEGEVQIIILINFHDVLDEPLVVRKLIGINERLRIPVFMNIRVAPIDGNAVD